MSRRPALLLVAALTLLSCASPEAPPSGEAASPDQGLARDVVWISVDTLRHDVLGYVGHEIETPAIDRLAAAGRVFTNARAHAVMTTPSHFSMLTGLHPDQHGVRDNGGFVLDEEIPTLTTFLAAEGFATGGFVGAYPLASEKGFGRDFDVYDDLRIEAEKNPDLLLGLPNPRAGVGSRPGPEVVSAALSWWRESAAQRRFLFVHVYDPHAPYEPPSPFKERYDDLYQGEVAWTDQFLTPLLDQLLAEVSPPLVIFTSDHGEALGEHGEPTHGFFAYEPTLRVPLVISGGGIEPGRDERNVRHVDLLPTTLEALGFDPANYAVDTRPWPGSSLLDPAVDWSEEATYFESLSPFFNFGWAPLRGVVLGDHKVIEQPIPELYDVSADPSEEVNRIDDRRAVARHLLDLLPDTGGFGLDERSMGDEERARLAALGYLDARGAKGRSVSDFSLEEDLKNAVGPYRRLRELVAWLHDGRHDDVVSTALELKKSVPDSPLLYSCWVAALIRRGDALQSLEVIREAMARDAASNDLRRQLGISLMGLGRIDEAIRELESEVERLNSEGTSDDMTFNVLGHAHLGRGDAKSAQMVFEHAVEKFPESPRAFENLSFLRLQLGDATGAESWARRALEVDEEQAGAWNNLGLALLELGQDRAALDAFDRSLQLAPNNADVLFNHGLIAAELGRIEQSNRSLRRFLASGPRPADPRGVEARRLLAAQ